MLLAMCFDTGMLVGLLFFVILLGALGAAPIILGVIAILKRADARQRRLAAESSIIR